jgi:ABC-2 type transport system ATP-binding protein
VVEAALGKDVREEISRAVVGVGAGLLELRPMALSLEDVFLRLVTDEDAAVGEAGGEAGREDAGRSRRSGGDRSG